MQFLKFFLQILFFSSITVACEPNKRKAYFTDVCFGQNLFYLFWISVVFIFTSKGDSTRTEIDSKSTEKEQYSVFILKTTYYIIIPGGLALGLVPESPYFLSHRGQSSSKAIQWLMVDPNWINEVEEDISKFLNHRNIDFTPKNSIFNTQLSQIGLNLFFGSSDQKIFLMPFGKYDSKTT